MTRSKFMEQMNSGEMLILPGVYNALSTKIAARAGFDTVFLSGAGISNNFLAEPDLGFLNFEQLKFHVEQILLSSNVSVIVDFDAGYGDAKLAVRQGRLLERLGVSGITIEDQQQPKRCGHFDGKQIIDVLEMSFKIQAIREMCPDLVIIGRTDALAVEGIEGALERTQRYHEAGADITFVEAPMDIHEMRAITKQPWPQAINIVEGGKTPLLSSYELSKLGYSVAIYANFASRMAMKVMQIAYRTLFTQRDTQLLIDELLEWDERQQLVGINEWLLFEHRYIQGSELDKKI